MPNPPSAPPDFERRLRALDLRQAELLGRSNQGEVLGLDIDGKALAIKRPTGRGLGHWLRRQTLIHEHAAYQRLAGLPGFPRCHGLIDQRLLVLDRIHGQPFRDAIIPDRHAFFDQLLQTIEAMHARGVAHGDLKRKDNLLIDHAGQPVIIDLGAATLRRPGRPFNNALFDFICRTDINAWVKLKYGGYNDIPPPDRERLRRSAVERMLARLRK